MSIYDLKSLDINLKLLSSESFQVNNITIKPLTLREVIHLGYTRYLECLSVVTAKIEDIVGEENKGKIPKEMNTMDIILSSQNEYLISTFINGLCLFLGEKDFSFTEFGIIFGEVNYLEYNDEKIINLEKCKVVNFNNFNEIVDVIRYQNCVKSPEEVKYNPVNDRARKIAEKLQKSQEQVKKVKAKNGDKIDFTSIVSSVSTKSNTISKFNVWDLTIYQLYDEYKRLEMIVGYDTSILAMMNGAKINDLKHWSAKIED